MQKLPLQELERRWDRCRSLLKTNLPAAEGLIVFSRLNIYYLSGTFGSGLFWLPLAGDPVLLCRRGHERARLESALKNIVPFQTYRDVEGILKNAGSPLTKTIAVEMNGLSWALGNSFTKYLSGYDILTGDRIISTARSRKTEWELERLRQAGAKHAKCLTEVLPCRLKAGMNELEIAHTLSELFFSEGHHGILRMETFGEEVFLGHVSIGDSANYPSVFNGPLGLRGVHPAIPYMGSKEIAWATDMPLSIDNGFVLEGYHTDKTQVYWLGTQRSIPEKIRAAHDFCIEMQEWVREHLTPGALPSEIWNHCISAVEKTGWSEGFMGLGSNKVGFVGHGIGLAIDEYPALAKGFDVPIEEGMVLAVEPKMGIPNVGMVGLENTFEVTRTGGKSLTGESYHMICVPG